MAHERAAHRLHRLKQRTVAFPAAVVHHHHRHACLAQRTAKWKHCLLRFIRWDDRNDRIIHA